MPIDLNQLPAPIVSALSQAVTDKAAADAAAQALATAQQNLAAAQSNLAAAQAQATATAAQLATDLAALDAAEAAYFQPGATATPAGAPSGGNAPSARTVPGIPRPESR